MICNNNLYMTCLVLFTNFFLFLNRDGCDWTFHQLNEHEIPLLIFSAGLGDVIEETVAQQSAMYDNMRIVSNYMDFNEQVMILLLIEI